MDFALKRVSFLQLSVEVQHLLHHIPLQLLCDPCHVPLPQISVLRPRKFTSTTALLLGCVHLRSAHQNKFKFELQLQNVNQLYEARYHMLTNKSKFKKIKCELRIAHNMFINSPCPQVNLIYMEPFEY